MTSGIAESLPCPEARYWSDREWNAYYKRRSRAYAPAPKLVVIPQAKLTSRPEKKAPQTLRRQREGATIYPEPIGPILVVYRPLPVFYVDADVQEPPRRVWTLDELSPDEVTSDDLIPFPLIVAWICRKHQMTRVELFSNRRTARLIEPRQELYGLARRHTLLSLPDIGRRMGGRDHTTVLHGLRKFEGWVAAGHMIPWQAERMGDR